MAWKEEGIWTVGSPSFPGAYGLGDTFAEAKRDFLDAVEALAEYLEEAGEDMPADRGVRIGEFELEA